MGIVERRLLYIKLQELIFNANDCAEELVSDIERAYNNMDEKFSNRKDDLKETLGLIIEIRNEISELVDKVNDIII